MRRNHRIHPGGPLSTQANGLNMDAVLKTYCLMNVNVVVHLAKQEVMEMRNMISQSGVQVDVDAPKGQDLAAIMAEVRAKYEKEALKNQEELKAWHETRVTPSSLIT